MKADWESIGIVAAGLLLLLVLAMPALGEPIHRGRHIEPTQEETACVLFVSNFTVWLMQPSGSPEEQQLTQLLIRQGNADLARIGAEGLSAGIAGEEVLAHLYKECLSQKGGNVL